MERQEQQAQTDQDPAGVAPGRLAALESDEAQEDQGRGGDRDVEGQELDDQGKRSGS